ncbi:MAG: type II toxin-antitoxin system VapC family toxin [Pirellulales bacterium]|nr:type II toxin-antitoxin system VapC family toxin [Pirellulales bacterium]
MNVLLDSNILLRLSQPGHPHEEDTTSAVDLLQQYHNCVMVPQTIDEFWVVATRPVDAKGLGFETDFAVEQRDRFLQLFPLLRDERAIYEQWSKLVDDHEVKGVKAHDARYVAALQRHGLTHLLTYNDRDFRSFDGITVFTPPEIVAKQQSDSSFLEGLT